jgi:ABC-type multidrug transport system fused ATPase/permease subunit
MIREPETIHPYELRARSTKGLLQRLLAEVSTLVREEGELAKAEAAERGAIAAVAARSFAFAAAFGLLALGCVTVCVIAALALVVNLWAAALIVSAVYAVAAFALRSVAMRTFARATEPALSKLQSILMPPSDGATIAERHARVEWTRRQVQQTTAALERKSDLLSPMRDTALGLGSIGVALGAIVRSGETKES